MDKALNLVLIGADEPLGEAVLAVLEADGPELARLWPVSLDEEVSGTVTYQGDELACLDWSEVDWSRADVLVLASPRADLARLGDVVHGQGKALVAPGSCLSALADNTWAGAAESRIVTTPDAAAIALARLLDRLPGSMVLRSAHAFVAWPLAALGKDGVEELVHQTRALFAMETPDAEVLPVRIAFNLVPASVGAGLDRERALATWFEARGPGVDWLVSCVWAPLVHGGAAILHGRLAGDVRLEELKAAWDSQGDVALMDEPLPGGIPTPATEGVDSDTVFVGRVMVQSAKPDRFSCWVCYDQIRLEAAALVAAMSKAWLGTR